MRSHRDCLSVKETKDELDAAKEFARRGPRTFEELRLSPEDIGFGSAEAIKKGDSGAAEDLGKFFRSAVHLGYQFHHIVGQFNEQFAAVLMHSTLNVIAIPTLLHPAITNAYRGSFSDENPIPTRRWLKSRPFDEQWEHGLGLLHRVGILRRK